MLELKNITKDYDTGSEKVHALKGIDLAFRSNEFVSILGPSGCGKTTMLNIIGGLDGYTSGDLVINGRSTKDFKDRDWDTYRNHSIGFVFQSYNLIPHQTVLRNVELALTLSGVGKKERRRRAAKALEDVGLGDQLNKRPAEMSGGQMQRVAIARALVNDPDIVLLDEPTGALDTETGIMVMEIFKKVAQDRLIIMVTHNPDLAEQYSTRIVRMLDGNVIGDTMPLTEEEMEQERIISRAKAEADARKKIPKMRYSTAFGLSLNNLFTKRGRTLLTGFAGSIGIIGIALIYAVSQGTSNYIDTVQQDALSSYPLSIAKETADSGAMLMAMGTLGGAGVDVEAGKIGEINITASVFSGIGTNDLQSFKKHLDEHYDEVAGDINTIKYSYSITPQIYTYDVGGNMLKANPSSMMSAMMGSAMSSSASIYSSFMTGLFNEMIDDMDLLHEQYDVVAGRWPETYDELIMVLTDSSHITDFLEYAIGLKDPGELTAMIQQIMAGQVDGLDFDENVKQYTYDELLSLKFKLVDASEYYRYNSEFGVWEDMTSDAAYMADLYEKSEDLKVVGIMAPKSGSTSAAMTPGMCYLPSLTSHVMEKASDSQIVKAQLLDRDTDVFSGSSFEDLAKEKQQGMAFENMISVDTAKLSSAFGFKINKDDVLKFVKNYVSDLAAELDAEGSEEAGRLFSASLETLGRGLADFCMENLPTYDLKGLGVEGFSKAAVITRSDVSSMVSAFMDTEKAKTVVSSLTDAYPIPEKGYTTVLEPVLSGALSGYVTSFASEHPELAAHSDELSGMGIELSAGTALLGNNAGDEIAAKASTGAVPGTVVSEMGKVMTSASGVEKIRKSMEDLPNSLTKILAGSLKVDGRKIASAFKFNLTEEELMRLMSAYSYSSNDERSYDSNLRDLGYSSLDDPTNIIIYLSDFAGKERFIDFLEQYNTDMEESGKEEKVISYTDITGVLMSSVKTIVDAITYVLIAFVSISLIVSSIMIGVITLISVQERTKEIGILRAIGASKVNVSSMFNAETVIIGFLSGVLGVTVTYLLCIPINEILHRLTHIEYLSAVLPVPVAVILVGISTVLTLVAGIIPSASAAKKDPVVALRTE